MVHIPQPIIDGEVIGNHSNILTGCFELVGSFYSVEDARKNRESQSKFDKFIILHGESI